ncbi:hypothetical protein PTKIN_Ptkin19aG0015200 [Pterospermum kingtungense]
MLSNLARRQILVSSKCKRCQKETETTTHALRECEFTKEVWQYTPYSPAWIVSQDTTTSKWWYNVMEKADAESFSNGLMIQWAIWNVRNAAVKNNAIKNAAHVAHQAVSLLQEFRNAQSRGGRPKKLSE